MTDICTEEAGEVVQTYVRSYELENTKKSNRTNVLLKAKDTLSSGDK